MADTLLSDAPLDASASARQDEAVHRGAEGWRVDFRGRKSGDGVLAFAAGTVNKNMLTKPHRYDMLISSVYTANFR